ncbi:MAG: AAA family ATPase [Herpetosiphon sp.]
MFASFLPADRRHALANAVALPEQMRGAALFADISGFTPLTEALAVAHGARDGAEELTRTLNLVYDALTAQVDLYGGSVVGFAGDALTCWFDGDDGARATACALAMQGSMRRLPAIAIPGDTSIMLGMKASVASGVVRRWSVGDARSGLLDVPAGRPLARLAEGDRLANSGEVLIDEEIAATLGAQIETAGWRSSAAEGRFAVVTKLHTDVAEQPWPALAEGTPSVEQVRPWLLPAVFERLIAGQHEFLGELRPVVALFLSFEGIDYAGDPEAGNKLQQFVRRVQAVIEQYEGALVALTTSDKGGYLYVVFGAPVAHDDDALRAVETAVGLRALGEELAFIRAVRTGIAMGRAYTGAYGGNHSRTYGIIGDASNLAARLMQAAGAGEVLLSSNVGSLVDRRYGIQALEPIAVKGKSARVPICRLDGVGEVAAARSSEPQYTLPIVGRQDELARIDEQIALAKAGQGQISGITGEAGMGKSRLAAEVMQRARDAGLNGFAGECQSYGTRTAYLVWRPIWRELLGVVDGHDLPTQIGTIAGRLAEIDPALAMQAPLLGVVLDLAIPDNEMTGSMSPPVRKQALEGVLVSVLRARAAAGALIILLEDCHWIDAVSRDLLEAIAKRLVNMPVVLLLAYRPGDGETEQRLYPTDLRYAQELRITELTPAETAHMINLKVAQLFAGGGDAQAPLVELITTRTQGNPFYIEELLNYLKDRQIDLANAAELAAVDMPGSLQRLILARIDRLTADQQLTIKVASIIGRRFAESWLWGVYPELGDRSMVEACLQALRQLDLTPLDTPVPEPTYLYKHIVTREVAYESLTNATRQRLHAQLAQFLEQTFAASGLPINLLAYHYGRSTNRPKEALYAAQAGELAVKNGAYADAHSYLTRALELVRAMPPSAQRSEEEIGLLLGLGGVVLVTLGQSAPEAKAAFERARELCHEVEGSPHLARALFGLWTYYLFRGDMRAAYELAVESLQLAEAEGDPEAQLHAHFALSTTMFWQGDFERSLAHSERVSELYDPALHLEYIARYAQNPRIGVTTHCSWALWIRGYPKRSLHVAEEALALARELDHDFSIVVAKPPLLFQHRRDMVALAEALPESMVLAQQGGNPVNIACGLLAHGWLLAAQGQGADGIAEIKQARQLLDASGVGLVEPLAVTILADACLLAGAIQDGLQVLDEALATAIPRQQIGYLAEQHRLRGELLRVRDGSGDRAEAERSFEQALEVARRQAARSFELRAAMSMARLWQTMDKDEAAARLVDDVYRQFNEGFETPDLQEAAALLIRLGGLERGAYAGNRTGT